MATNIVMDFIVNIKSGFKRAGFRGAADAARKVGREFKQARSGVQDFNESMKVGRKQFQQITPSFRNLSLASKKFGVDMRTLRNSVMSGDLEMVRLGKNSKTTAENIELVANTTKGQKRIMDQDAVALRRAAKSNKALNFHMFGALFIGMQLQQTFLGIFRGSKLLSGIFDSISTIISAALLPVFLPLALFLLDLALAFLNMDESTRKLVGGIILFIGVAGLLIMVIGLLSLGWTGFLAAAGFVLPILLPIIAVLKFLKEMFDKNRTGLQKLWTVIKLVAAVLAGVLAVALGATVGWAVALGAALFLVLSHLKEVWNFLKGIGSFVGDKIGNFLGFGETGVGAAGGIVTRPTLSVIGEKGPEAVVPLSDTSGSSPLPVGGGGGVNVNVNAGLDADEIIRVVNEQLSSALRGAGIR